MVEQLELLELKRMVAEQNDLLRQLILFLPAKVPVSYLADVTGKSRQAMHNYLMSHYEPGVDFWMEKNKRFVNQQVAMSIIGTGAKK